MWEARLFLQSQYFQKNDASPKIIHTKNANSPTIRWLKQTASKRPHFVLCPMLYNLQEHLFFNGHCFASPEGEILIWHIDTVYNLKAPLYVMIYSVQLELLNDAERSSAPLVAHICWSCLCPAEVTTLSGSGYAHPVGDSSTAQGTQGLPAAPSLTPPWRQVQQATQVHGNSNSKNLGGINPPSTPRLP